MWRVYSKYSFLELRFRSPLQLFCVFDAFITPCVTWHQFSPQSHSLSILYWRKKYNSRLLRFITVLKAKTEEPVFITVYYGSPVFYGFPVHRVTALVCAAWIRARRELGGNAREFFFSMSRSQAARSLRSCLSHQGLWREIRWMKICVPFLQGRSSGRYRASG